MPDEGYEKKVEAVNRRFFRTMTWVFVSFVVVGTIIGILIELNEPAEALPVLLGLLIGASVGGVVTMLTVPRHYNKELEHLRREHRAK